MLQAAEAQGMTPTNPRNLAPPKGHAFRNNERLLVHDPGFANELFEYMRPVLETIVRVEDQAVPCGLSPDFRFYRYVKGEDAYNYVLSSSISPIISSCSSFFSLPDPLKIKTPGSDPTSTKHSLAPTRAWKASSPCSSI